MTIVAQFSWDDIASEDFGNPARIVWREAVAEIAEKAHEKLPECNGRIDKAVALVLAGDVELQANGTARVASQSNGSTQYVVCNGHCACKDYQKAPHNFCEHRLSAAIVRRAQELTKMKLAQLDQASNGTSIPPVEHPQPSQATPAVPLSEETPGVPEVLKPFITHLHGKPFVRYAGLLALAHERGLQSLEASFLHVTDTLATAQATAVFTDGRRFTECADSTPDNVPFHIKPHFARMALTRCKARALRDALNIGLTALEEVDAE